MRSHSTEKAYRQSALQSASPVQLVLTLYDILVNDLRRFCDALRSVDYEKQTAAIKHALSVLELLEGSLDKENGGTLAESLAQYYGMVRSSLLGAQVSQQIKAIEYLMDLVMQVRGSFEEKDRKDSAAVRLSPTTFQPIGNQQQTGSWSG